MIPSAIANTFSQCLSWTTQKIFVAESLAPLYRVACNIFRVMEMSAQYSVVLASITLRHCCWFSYSIPAKYITVSSRNIASFAALPKCFATAMRPIPKPEFAQIGRAQGLRITHDIVYQPANGLCLANSLLFLSKYLSANEIGIDNDVAIDSTATVIAAAKVLAGGGTETSVRIQAIYEALIGMQGLVQIQEIEPTLAFAIETFKSIHGRPETLRQFVFNDLERKGVEITPDIYATTLELDAAWHYRQNSEDRKYGRMHEAITEAVANTLQLEVREKTKHIQGKITSAVAQLNALANGSYLVQFHDHAIPFIKTQNWIALSNPNEGMALLTNPREQQESIQRLLEFYGIEEEVSLTISSIGLQKASEPD